MSVNLLRNWQPSDPSVRDCWQLIVRGIDAGMLNDDDLNGLLKSLERREDLVLDELGFEFVGSALRVRFLDEKLPCAPDELIR